MTALIIQGRVFASSPDEAAMKIRDKYNGCQGKLVILEAERLLGAKLRELC